MARNTRTPKPWSQAKPRAKYPNGWPSNVRATLYLNRHPDWTAGGDSPKPPDPYGPNIAEGYNLETWWRSEWSMGTVTPDSFTNDAGTASIIGNVLPAAEIGATYRIEMESQRGGGALRCYFTDTYDVAQGSPVYEPANGEETFELVANGKWFAFRISLQNTTTTVPKLIIRKVLGS